MKKDVSKRNARSMSEDERRACAAIAKIDSRIIDDRTIVTYDKTTRNRDGSRTKRYIVSQGRVAKYEAKFVENETGTKLVQIASVKRTEKKPPEERVTVADRIKRGIKKK